MVPDSGGEELARLSMRCVTRVRLEGRDGLLPRRSVAHGSMTLLRLPGGRPVGATCQHVIQAYRERHPGGRPCRFRVGSVVLSPEERLLAEEPFLDLAILDLDGVEPATLSAGRGDPRFFQPVAWPLGSAQAGELLFIGGFSGARRRSALRADPDPVPAEPRPARVIDAGEENIVCEVTDSSGEIDRASAADDLEILGGLSGGAGFVRRGPEVHFVGVVFAVARSGAYLRLRPARFIQPDGTLLPRGIPTSRTEPSAQR